MILSRKNRRELLIWAGMALVIFFFIGPFFWLIISSVQPEDELIAVPPNWIPKGFTLENYRSFLNPQLRQRLHLPGAADQVMLGLKNSFTVAAFVMVVNLIFGVPAAYSFARFQYRTTFYMFLFLLFTRMVPAVAIVIPFYLLMKQWGMLNTLSSVILAHSTFTLPFTVWILRGYFITIPVELEKAARMDGCGRLGAIVRVLMPISAPGLITAAIFAFMFSWNEFFFALVLTGSGSTARTIPVVASLFVSDIMTKYGIINACGVMAVILPIAFVIFFNKYIRQGLVTGSIR